MTNVLAEPLAPEAGRRRPRRGYLSVALVTVLPAAIVLLLGENAPLVMVGGVWLLGTLTVVFAPQFPVGQKAVAVALLPACAIAWRIVHLARGETLCLSSSEHPVTVCSAGHPGVSRILVAPALVAVVLIIIAALAMRSRRSRG
jgi:hypothetical protein